MTKFKNAPNIKIPSTNGETFELKKIKNKIDNKFDLKNEDIPSNKKFRTCKFGKFFQSNSPSCYEHI